MEAKTFPSYTLAATICGYIIGIITIPKFISQVTALRICTLLGTLLTLLIIFTKGQVSFFRTYNRYLHLVCGITGTGQFIGMGGHLAAGAGWLGRFTKLGASVMIMGLCGNAILPLIYGWLADSFDVRHAYWVLYPVICILCFMLCMVTDQKMEY
jgi:FHS family L-fucose permease-like MFS transporter